jgi:hypothetical protein
MVNLVVHGELRHIKQLGNFTTTAVTGYSSRIGLTWQFGRGTCFPPLVSDSRCLGWSNPRLTKPGFPKVRAPL